MNNPFAQALSAALNYAVVSRQVSDENNMVGFMYREAAAFEQDSGWRLFSGAEDDDFVNNPDNFITIPLNEALEICPEIKSLLAEKQGAWEWDDDAQDYVNVTDWQPQE
ncbi:DUF2185 domain-containing protein [Kingella negevensis]|uniref:Immunity protein Imm33 domain-containing protein n=1 Tax=Kingella negevensis TaxID=1522312 RepID=A0A238TCV0_9NEIS|nr:DUF2185 domain-containing protein [Kingella negevensis]MDK4687804.1 DUF2185 domain-containing protein [Kingella negevensis]WII91200.1 DUF2185 domain-containing protein [Kingella negevensis]SNB67693.1 Uncharacterised protein [Kingella negevensis]